MANKLRQRFLRKFKYIFQRAFWGRMVGGTLGKNTTVGRGSFIDHATSIGCETFINTNCTVTKAVIGNYCSIGSNVVIGPGEHTLSAISLSGRFYKESYEELTKRPVILGHDVWVGTHAIILRGVTVGHGAVIGANSVVTKDIPPFAVVAGVPARILKYRFDEMMRTAILESHWFEHDLDRAKEIIKLLEKSNAFN